jgi:hypothetical protein
MNRDRTIAELRDTIPHGREYDFVRVEFDRACQLAIEKLKPVAHGWMTADEAFTSLRCAA